MACLGAGFMLIETKAVVQMALLFGGTWLVNAVVFIAVLLMILGANVFGSPWDKLLIIAVLTSASASCQTTILPATRSALSMAAKRAAPKTFGTVHPEYLTPSVATIWMGVISV